MNRTTIPKWYLKTSTELVGPFTAEDLAALARKGKVLKSSMLQSVESGNWIRADQMPFIFDAQISKQELTVPQGSISKSGSSQALDSGPPQLPFAVATKHANPTPSATSTPWIIGVTVMVIFAIGLLTVPFVVMFSRAPIADKDDSQTPPAIPNSDSRMAKENTRLSTVEIVEITAKSVAMITSDSGAGSGFVVAPNVVATNYHVVAGAEASSIDVYFPDGEKGKFEAVVIAEQPKRDLALLRIRSQTKPLAIDEGFNFTKGQDVVIIGSPALFRGAEVLPNAVSHGILSSQAEIDGNSHYQLSAAVNPGNSGGPVLGPDAKVIGVVVAKSKTEEAISFCIPAKDLKTLVNRYANSNPSNSEKTIFEHNSRRVIHAVTEQTLGLESAINGISTVLSRNGVNIAELSAASFTKEVTLIFEKESPALVRNFSLEFSEILKSPQISIQQRTEIELLRQRHESINRLMRNPPGNLVRLNLDFEKLREQYLAQLRVVGESLELQQY